MATMQTCNPFHAGNSPCDETKQPKIAQKTTDCKSPEKKHHVPFWHGRGNEPKNNQQANNKQQNEPKTGHRLTQWLGQGAQKLHSEKLTSIDESDTIVINRKIKERIVITHAKKSTEQNKDGEKHYTRC